MGSFFLSPLEPSTPPSCALISLGLSLRGSAPLFPNGVIFSDIRISNFLPVPLPHSKSGVSSQYPGSDELSQTEDHTKTKDLVSSPPPPPPPDKKKNNERDGGHQEWIPHIPKQEKVETKETYSSSPPLLLSRKQNAGFPSFLERKKKRSLLF